MSLIPEQIAQAIRNSIIKGERSPGERLDPESLCNEFRVSRTTVCQGLRQLATEGFVNYEETVAVVADINEALDIRLLLEPEALRLAVPNHTEKIWSDAAEILRQIDALPDGESWIDRNWQFHRVLYSTAQRPRLLDIISSLHTTSDFLSQKMIDYRAEAQADHWKILEACKQRDVNTACRILIEHINQRRLRLFNSVR